MKIRGFWIIFLLLVAIPVFAQDNPAILAIRTDITDMQTGEFYPVRIEIDNVTALWSATMRIVYDPEQIYIVGTDSGSPVQLGDFLSEGLIIQNSVNEREGYLLYTPSLLAPADPTSGSGVLGTFLIFPLQAGEVTLSFMDAEMSSIVFTTNEQGFRTVQESLAIPFVVTQLTLNVTGDMVTPPPEATATPTPSVTPFVPRETDEPTFTPEPTLVVVTDASASAATQDESAEAATPTILYVAIGLIVFALVGLVGLFVYMRRGGSK